MLAVSNTHDVACMHRLHKIVAVVRAHGHGTKEYVPLPCRLIALECSLQRVAHGHGHRCGREPKDDAAGAARVLQHGGGSINLRNDGDKEREKHCGPCEGQGEYRHVAEGGGDVGA
jgi:hypothetical protein